MAARASLFALVFLIGTMGSLEVPPELVVWNVGQGQWATLIDDRGCTHLDMGGEFAPWSNITARCRRRLNRVSLSHWDMDHINLVQHARQSLPDMCILNAPLGPTSPRKQMILERIKPCRLPSEFAQWGDINGVSANAKSWVINGHGVLAPGDSPRTAEKIWLHHLAHLAEVRVLILGHHGSRTSTSPEMLHTLQHLRLAIASARKRRYGHPHPEVVEELRRARIPLLKTEEWGSIHVFL